MGDVGDVRISPEQLAGLLSKVAASQKEGSSGGRLYVCLNANKELVAASEKEIQAKDSNLKPLTLQTISDIADKAIQQALADMKGVDIEDWNEIVSTIKHMKVSYADIKQELSNIRNVNESSVYKTILAIISFISLSYSKLLGEVLAQKFLDKIETKITESHARHLEQLPQLSTESARLQKVKNEQMPEMLRSFENLVTNRMSDNEVQTVLDKSLKESASNFSTTSNPMLKDAGRGLNFEGHDNDRTVTLAASEKNKESEAKARKEATEQVGKVLTSNDDKVWEIPLQCALSQKSYNKLHLDIATQAGVMGMEKRKENDQDHYFTLKESQKPHIEFTVKRDSDNKISSLDFKITGSLNLVEIGTSTQNEAIFAREVVKGELTYRLTLDKNGEPKVSDLKRELTYHNPLEPKKT